MEHSIITECLCKSFGEKSSFKQYQPEGKKGRNIWIAGTVRAPVKRHF